MPPYRCISHGDYHSQLTGASQVDAIRHMLIDIHGVQKIRDDPQCGVIDPDWCKEEGKLYPIPCNCHAYFQCVRLEAGRPLLPCPHKCHPYDLVFNPMNGVCNNEDTAPPGTCFDTPTGPSTVSTTPMTTTPITTPTTMTTPGPEHNCTYVGEKFPYPGNCHLYY